MLLSSAGSGRLCIQRPGRVSRSVINEGRDEQPGCILITHKDKERYGKGRKRGNESVKRKKEREGDHVLISQSVRYDITVGYTVKNPFSE